MKVTLRATFTEWEWESDEPDTDPTIVHGWADPNNPWGGLDVIPPDDLCGEPYAAWVDENVKTIEFSDDEPDEFDGEWQDDGTWRIHCALDRAAAFIDDFPGGVWDLREANPEQDYRTGVYREVTLHVEAEPTAFDRLLLGRTKDPILRRLLDDPTSLVLAQAQKVSDLKDARLRAYAERTHA